MVFTEKVKEKAEHLLEELKGSVDALKREVKELRERVAGPGRSKESGDRLPVTFRREEEENPLRELQSRTNRLFDDFLEDVGRWSKRRGPRRRFSFWGLGNGVAPGGRERNCVGSTGEGGTAGDGKGGCSYSHIDEGFLTIRGEKKVEEKEEGKNYRRVECFSGSFLRSIPLPADVEPAKAEASFKKRILTVKLPKKGASSRGRRIEVKEG